MEESSTLRQRAAVVERLYHKAAALAPRERHTFLTKVCEGDETLRREVELLLEQSDSSSGLLDASTGRIAEPLMGVRSSTSTSAAPTAMRMAVGDQLGTYTITAVLGKGGMGEVYRARDRKLGRDVAIKILSSERSTAESRRRFEREARVASSLNHPHILTVHDVDEFEGSQYIVTELVDGGTLKDWLAERPRSWQQVVELLSGLADGLAAAHEAGILHRDIKPANILVSRNGYAKLADFGLATLHDPRPPSDASTRGTDTTRTGIILGTVPYMSPEQALGLTLDSRGDVFSFGIVLSEALTGRRPFDSDSDLQVLQAIIHDDPRPLGSHLPARLRALVEKALEKDPARRYQSMREMVVDLKALLRSPAETSGSKKGSDLKGSTQDGPVTPARKWSSRRVLIPTLALVAAVIAATFWMGTSRVAPLTERDVILVTDFENKTGDPAFDDTLKQATEIALGQSPFINIFSGESVRQFLRFKELPEDERITESVARDICRRAGLKAILAGSIAQFGNNYVINLKAENCATGERIAGEQREAASKEQIITSLSDATASLRKSLGESLASIQKFDTPLDQVTTASFDALQSFSRGARLAMSGDFDGARPFFKRAIDLDRNFASAYRWLGTTYWDGGNPDLGRKNSEKAFELRDRTSERERLDISAGYYRIFGDLRHQIEASQQGKQAFPQVAGFPNILAHAYESAGRFEDAIAEEQEGVRLEPASALLRFNLARMQVRWNRFDDARETIKKARELKLEHPGMRGLLSEIAFIQGGEPGMLEQIKAEKGRAQGRLIDSAVYSGRLTEAAKSLSQERLLNNRALFGFQNSAKDLNALLSAFAPGARIPTGIIRTLAVSGETSSAKTLLDPWKKSDPQDTLLHAVTIPTIEAVVEMREGRPDKAIERLRAVIPYQFSDPSWIANYHRGLAYLEIRAGAEAAAEFQKIIEHRGLWAFSPLYPLSYLGLGRAYVLTQNLPQARKSYEEFFKIWENADHNIPVLVQAKEEYAKIAPTN